MSDEDLSQSEIIHVLRNQYGYTPVFLKETRLAAADEIGRLQSELCALKERIPKHHKLAPADQSRLDSIPDSELLETVKAQFILLANLCDCDHVLETANLGVLLVERIEDTLKAKTDEKLSPDDLLLAIRHPYFGWTNRELALMAAVEIERIQAELSALKGTLGSSK